MCSACRSPIIEGESTCLLPGSGLDRRRPAADRESAAGSICRAWPGIHHRREGRRAHSFPAGAYLLTGDAKIAEKTQLVELLRSQLGQLGHFDKMRSALIVANIYDGLIDSELITPQERPQLRAQMAYLAYNLADPYTWIYKKDILEKDPHWYEKNIMGSGPFKLVKIEVGQSITGERNPDYYHKGLPYLDGIVGIFAEKQSVRTDALKADRGSIEFRGLPPSARDQLTKELGDKIWVQDSDWNCGNILTPNHQKKPFDDVRVRKALALAIDQWHGAPALAKIANVRTVGGIVFPGSPLAATKEELQKIAGFWPDIEKSRAEAKRLLKEAGAEGLKFELLNRNVDQPYKYVGTWAVAEWKKIGLNVEQKVVPTGP